VFNDALVLIMFQASADVINPETEAALDAKTFFKFIGDFLELETISILIGVAFALACSFLLKKLR
jgi:NhaP-type Na+/H+ or K+/H+ antiporter